MVMAVSSTTIALTALSPLRNAHSPVKEDRANKCEPSISMCPIFLMVIKMKIEFNDIDKFYLANYLTQQQLKHEIANSKKCLEEIRDFENWPCQLINSPIFLGADDKGRQKIHWITSDEIESHLEHIDFDYEGYMKVCQEALTWTPGGNDKKPEPYTRKRRIDIDSLKARLDIVAEVERYTPLRKSGNNRFLGQCPLHEDKHPSMTIYADKQSWHCFQCNKGGDVIDFIMAVEGVDFQAAAALLGAK